MPKSRRIHGVHLLASLGLAVVIGGASSSPGGCGSGTVPSKTVVDESCPGPGCDIGMPGSGNDCGTAAGQCPCTLSGSTDGYCGYCSTAAPDQVCRYCPQGTYCPSDPCSSECPTNTGSPGGSCPPDYPVDCGGGSCCPSDHPSCCADKAWCGTDAAACQNVDNTDSTSSGDMTGGGCGWDCASQGLSPAQTRDGCCSSGSCPNSCSDICGNGWYEVNGQIFGPCTVQDTACMQNAAQAALSACGN